MPATGAPVPSTGASAQEDYGPPVRRAAIEVRAGHTARSGHPAGAAPGRDQSRSMICSRLVPTDT
jgi:hypothetical protein